MTTREKRMAKALWEDIRFSTAPFESSEEVGFIWNLAVNYEDFALTAKQHEWLENIFARVATYPGTQTKQQHTQQLQQQGQYTQQVQEINAQLARISSRLDTIENVLRRMDS